jgi:MHS family proline/betaine transporter-like MFS transporter
LSGTINNVFFPSSDPALQSIALWGVFAVGFVVRPLGAVLFGHLADNHSRKLALVTSIVLMALATMLIGCIPSYSTIGITSPVLLAILRALQGLAMGGEYGTSVRVRGSREYGRPCMNVQA